MSHNPRRSLLSEIDAAARVGVSRSTIQRWHAAGTLQSAGTVAGRRYYLEHDVLTAERDTRSKHKRRRP